MWRCPLNGQRMAAASVHTEHTQIHSPPLWKGLHTEISGYCISLWSSEQQGREMWVWLCVGAEYGWQRDAASMKARPLYPILILLVKAASLSNCHICVLESSGDFNTLMSFWKGGCFEITVSPSLCGVLSWRDTLWWCHHFEVGLKSVQLKGLNVLEAILSVLTVLVLSFVLGSWILCSDWG